VIAYLDSSAFVKLIKEEDESAALAEALRAWPERASSRLLRVEVMRAAHLAGPEAAERAETLLRDVALLPLSEPVLERAIETRPAAVRTLDAIHMASALALGADLGVLLTYDERMRDAARRASIETLTPR